MSRDSSVSGVPRSGGYLLAAERVATTFASMLVRWTTPAVGVPVDAETARRIAVRAQELDGSATSILETVRRTRGRAKVEISGGVTLEHVPALAATGAEFASAGALTHSAPAIDISFEIEAL